MKRTTGIGCRFAMKVQHSPELRQPIWLNYTTSNVLTLSAAETIIRYDTIRYDTIRYNTTIQQYNNTTIQHYKTTIQQYNNTTIQYNTIQYNTIQYNTIQYNTK